jgi:hypothetical protein
MRRTLRDVATPEKIEEIRQIVEEDPRIKAHQIAAQARASKSEVLLILHKLTRHDNTDPPDGSLTAIQISFYNRPQNFFLQGLQ